jgi:hypothetical protein
MGQRLNQRPGNCKRVSERTNTSANHMDGPWTGLHRQLRINNILLVIVAVEIIAVDGLQWWNVP